ncbi:HET domain-containing protein [Microdochium nivale]|nr:HET domain-containing protein [Microdochium nivale]
MAYHGQSSHADALKHKTEPPGGTTSQTLPRITLPPLDDPHKQIRLLKLDAAEFDDEIRCTVLTCELSSAPEFNAISYTWGPEQPRREILVDGTRFPIRENCHYAIQQARHHASSLPVWLDSICINQDDLAEKSAQVGFMGEVYAKAETVLACVGPSDEASDALATQLKLLSEMFGLSLMSDAFGTTSAFEYVQSLPKGEQHALVKIQNDFSARSYFHRVWIVQELFEGWGRISVLCGLSLWPWNLIERFGHVTHSINYGRGRIANRISEIERFNDDAPTIWSEALEFTAKLLCTDPRDRIYGMIRLIDWEASRVPRLIPDYELSLLQIVMGLARHGQSTDVAVFRDLILSMHLPQSDFLCGSSAPTKPPHEVVDWAAAVHDTHVVRVRDNGQLYVDQKFAAPGKSWNDMSDPRFRQLFDGHELVEIFGPTGVVALACAGTLPGDILFLTGFSDAVVRPVSQQCEYQVVGRAMLSPAGNRFMVAESDCSPSCDCTPATRNWYHVIDSTVHFQAPVQHVIRHIYGRNTQQLLSIAKRPESRPRPLQPLDIPVVGSIMRQKIVRVQRNRPIPLSVKLNAVRKLSRH